MQIIKTLLIFCVILFPLSSSVIAEEVYRIEIGQDYRRYSDSDLRRRTWELERAVWQLQQRVFQLEASKAAPPAPPAQPDTWVCTIKAFNDTFTGTGGSKAVAISKVVENCKAAREGNGFFCKEPKCEQ